MGDDGKIKDATGANGSTGEGPMDKTNNATSFFTLYGRCKETRRGCQRSKSQEMLLRTPCNNFVVKVKLHVKVGVLFGGNNRGLCLDYMTHVGVDHVDT